MFLVCLWALLFFRQAKIFFGTVERQQPKTRYTPSCDWSSPCQSKFVLTTRCLWSKMRTIVYVVHLSRSYTHT